MISWRERSFHVDYSWSELVEMPPRLIYGIRTSDTVRINFVSQSRSWQLGSFAKSTNSSLCIIGTVEWDHIRVQTTTSNSNHFIWWYFPPVFLSYKFCIVLSFPVKTTYFLRLSLQPWSSIWALIIVGRTSSRLISPFNLPLSSIQNGWQQASPRRGLPRYLPQSRMA